MNIKKLNALMAALFLTTACTPSSREVANGIKPQPDKFSSHWYQGQAEITRFELKQARYGEIHEGDAVQIFVTEPFLKDQQVKRDFGNDPSISVLKLNFTKKFTTGIYPYSLMTSIFTEVGYEDCFTPKVTFSSQEWCGNIYAQMNYRDKSYETQIHSYFQAEQDHSYNLDDAHLEDELWTLIRIAPNRLPLGDIKMIPSLEYSRLAHLETKVYEAETKLSKKTDRRFSKKEVYAYQVAYKGLSRSLEIFFEMEAPYAILGWQEVAPHGSGEDASEMTTLAVRSHTMLSDYWNKNGKKDRDLRKKLGLTP